MSSDDDERCSDLQKEFDTLLEENRRLKQQTQKFRKMGPGSDRRTTHCGVGAWRPALLQMFNKPSVFVFLFSMIGFSMSITIGMNQILMPTLQQLFNMTTKQMGLILISNDISGLAVAFIFGHFSSSGKIRWICLGVFISLVSGLMQAGTQLFVQLPDSNITRNSSIDGQVTCSVNASAGPGIPAVSDIGGSFYAVQNNNLFWILFAAGMLQGVGNTPFFVSGMTYIDEIMTQKKLGPTLAYTQIVQYVGFPASFVLGAYLLTNYVTMGPPPDGVVAGSSQWVGAWWMGYLIPAILMVTVGLPLSLFPVQMPAAMAVLQKKINRGETSAEEKGAELNRSFAELVKDMVPTLKRLSLNRPLVFLLVGEGFMNIFLGSMPYDTKLYTMIFKISVSETGTILGLLRIVGSILGLVIGGAIVAKFNLTGKKCMLWVAAMQLISLPLTLLPLLHCNPDNMAGVTTPYFNQAPVGNLSNECNAFCGCSTGFYEPVCDEINNVTYFSACHAGCTTTDTDTATNEVWYGDCKCSRDNKELVAGACPPEDTCTLKKWVVFIGGFVAVIIFISIFPAMNIAYLRVVPEIDRSATQGLKQFVSRALGFVPGPIIFGAIIDAYCTVWRGEGSGSCWIYDINTLMRTFTMTQLGIRALSIVCFFISWRLYPEKTPYQQLSSDKPSHQLETVKK